MSKRQDEIAAKAVRKSTLRSIAVKKRSRLKNLRITYEKQVREINIQYAEDPERLKAKYAAADYAKNEKAKKRAERKIANEKSQIEISKNSRIPTVGEEISSSIIQGIGACIFIAALAILDTIAVSNIETHKIESIIFYSLFGASMILMYLFSTLKHSLTNAVAKQVFNRLSHVFSFLSIGFAYSAFTLIKVIDDSLQNKLAGWILFGIVWAIVLTGIIFYSISGNKHDKVNIILASIAGFSGLVIANFLFKALSVDSFAMLITAAVFYMIAIIFYCLKKVKGMHFIANCLFLCGSIALFLSLFFFSSISLIIK